MLLRYHSLAQVITVPTSTHTPEREHMNRLYQDASLCPRFTKAENIHDLGAVPPYNNVRKVYIELASIELDRRVRSFSPSPSGMRKRDLSETSLESMASAKTGSEDAATVLPQSREYDLNAAAGAIMMLKRHRTEQKPSR